MSAPPPGWTLAHLRVSPFLFDLLLQFFWGIDTQLCVDSDPHTGLTVLVECLTSSWSNTVRVSISFVDSCPHTGLSVLDNWVFGFGWIRWVSLLLTATSDSNSFIQLSLKEIVGGGRGDTYTFSYMISPDSSQLLSRYNKLGVYRREWLRSILFDSTSILSVEQVVYQPKYTGSWCILYFFCLYHARPGASKPISYGSLCSLFTGFTAVKNTVCLSLLKICPPGISPGLWWSVNWLHIHYDECTRRNCPE